MSKRFNSMNEFAELLGCSVRHLDNMTKTNQVPAPICLGRLKKWSCRAIREWADKLHTNQLNGKAE